MSSHPTPTLLLTLFNFLHSIIINTIKTSVLRPPPVLLLHRESNTLFTAGSEAAAVNGCRRFVSLVRLHESGLAHAPSQRWPPTIALKGHDTPLNFSNDLINYLILASLAAGDIRVAAARAAANRAEGNVRQGGGESSSGAGNVMSSDDGGGGGYYEYMEEEALLNMPKMLAKWRRECW